MFYHSLLSGQAANQQADETAVKELNSQLLKFYLKLHEVDDNDSDDAHESPTSPLANEQVSFTVSGGSVSEQAPSQQAVAPGGQIASSVVRACVKVLRSKAMVRSHALAAQLLAELARGQSGRDACVQNEEVVLTLGKALEIQYDERDYAEAVVQVRFFSVVATGTMTLSCLL